MAASAGIVFTGEQGGNGTGQGRAAILSDNNFLPYFMQIQNQKARERAQVLQEKKEKQKQWNTFNKEMKFEPVWSNVDKELEDDFVKATDELTALQMEGYDPADTYGPAGKKYQETYRNFQRKRQMAEEAKKAYDAAYTEFRKNPTAYDDDAFLNWANGFKGKSVEDMWEHANSGSPLKPIVTDAEVLEEYAPDYFAKTEEQGIDTFSSKGIRDKDFEAVILGGMESDPKVKAHYERGLEKGRWKDVNGYVDEMYKIASSAKPGETKKTSDEGRTTSSKSGGGFSFDASTGVAGTDKIRVASESRTEQGLKQGVTNYASVIRTGTNDDLPFVKVSTQESLIKGKEGTNELVDFQPVEYVLGENGKIGVKGIASLPTGDTDANGKPIYDQKEVWIDYDRNKKRFEAQLGFSMYDVLGKGGAANTQAKQEYEKVVEKGGKKYGLRNGEWYEIN